MASRPRPLASFLTTTGPNGERTTIEIDVGANDGKAEKKFGPGDELSLSGLAASKTLANVQGGGARRVCAHRCKSRAGTVN